MVENVDVEFLRITKILVECGDLDIFCHVLPITFKKKQDFVKKWKEVAGARLCEIVIRGQLAKKGVGQK